MSIATLPAVAPGRPKADPDDDHLYCCNPDLSLCGMDISDSPERDFPDHECCLVCLALEDTPCGPGCPDGGAA
ncbi:hypothetical protein [Nonomuraea indica]|uniref:hypothetical protein n=1 Tax=Nonomuraea indica TaxID=1581193 RepID=UPI000C7B606E|nr:hypothetical protein [Nonomuraea indica]